MKTINDIQDFVQAVISDLKEALGEGFEVMARNVTKNNGVILRGISICTRDESVSPTIYLEELYERYSKGSINIPEATTEILKAYSANKCKVDQGTTVQCITDYSWAKDNIIFRLVNRKRNEGLLSEIPHREFLDLAIIYTVFIKDIFDTPGNVIIRNDLMDKWGVDEEDLYKTALNNAPFLKKPITMGLGSMISELLGPGQSFDEDTDISMTVITNDDKFYGDSVILYPGVLSRLAEESNASLYLLPSSVHEFIAVPVVDSVNADELAELVRSVNGSCLSQEDYLSDTVYLYDQKTQKISVA